MIELSNNWRTVPVACALLAVLGACGQATALTPSIVRAAGHPWMAPNTSSQALLYVTGGCGGICIFTYPQDQLVGELGDAYYPQGECVDKSGDIFIADFGGENGSAGIVEYAHGGTQPIATLSDPGYYPQSCSIDPTTGNLAVTNDTGPIAIYAGAKGDPTYYADSKASADGFCAYDDKGNLFVDGEYTKSGDYALLEMPKSSYTFKNIRLNRAPGTPLDIQWVGKYLAVADSQTVIYHVKIKGSKGTVVGSTLLNGPVSGIEVQFWIEGKTIIDPYGTGNSTDEVGFWKYPSGGKLRSSIDISQYGYAEVFGTVLSPAANR